MAAKRDFLRLTLIEDATERDRDDVWSVGPENPRRCGFWIKYSIGPTPDPLSWKIRIHCGVPEGDFVDFVIFDGVGVLVAEEFSISMWRGLKAGGLAENIWNQHRESNVTFYDIASAKAEAYIAIFKKHIETEENDWGTTVREKMECV